MKKFSKKYETKLIDWAFYALMLIFFASLFCCTDSNAGELGGGILFGLPRQDTTSIGLSLYTLNQKSVGFYSSAARRSPKKFDFTVGITQKLANNTFLYFSNAIKFEFNDFAIGLMIFNKNNMGFSFGWNTHMKAMSVGYNVKF